MPGKTVDGPRGAAHPSGSRDMVPRNWCSPDRRLTCLPSLIRGCSMERGMRLVHCLILTPWTQDPTRTPRSLAPSILRTQAASCYSSDTAFFEARSRGEAVSPTGQCVQSHQRPMHVAKYARSWPQFWTGSAARTHWRRSTRGAHRRRIRRRRDPATGQPRPRAARSTTHEQRVRKDLMTLHRDYWIRQQHPVHRRGRPRTLQRGAAIVCRSETRRPCQTTESGRQWRNN